MLKICLIRHGETDWNREGRVQGASDIPLNERGIKQAHIAGRYLAGYSWDRLYASPLSRAYDTAAIVAGHVGLCDIRTEPLLEERNFGELEGLDEHRRREFFGNRPVPGAETREEVQNRAFEVLNRLALEHPGKRLLVVSHGGVIAYLLHLLSNGNFIPGNPPLYNLSMNMLTYDGTWKIKWYNRLAPELEYLRAGV